MFDDINKRFDCLLEVAKSNDLPVEIIKKAYMKAKDLHKDQKRRDGTPYISHPVEVALILAKLDFDENVIAGALLHDTIEDCGYTADEMKADFNETIFKLVDCVSAIDKTKYVFDKENIYEDPEFVKSSAEEQTFKKLITLGKENPCGFAIKFADRLHNLRTISTFDYSKQLEKVRETEKWVLPIAKLLQSIFFYRAIKNECFKIVNKYNASQYFDHYNIYHKSNKRILDNLNISLKESITNSSMYKIIIEEVKEFKVFDDLLKIYKKINIAKISQGQILKVANYNIFIIYKDVSHKKALGELMHIIQTKGLFDIIDIRIGWVSNKIYLVVEDKFKNKFNIFVLTEMNYKLMKAGTLDGQNLEKIDENNINDIDSDFIRIKTRSGEVKYVPKGSTVLDFAFKIHRDVGFSFKYAIINDSKTKFPPYAKLNEGDKVEIITEKDVSGNAKNNTQLKWLAYVNTELAKKILIKYYEKLYKD